MLAQWRTVVANRPFLLFSTAMIGSYVLTFQVYLALPLAASDAPGSSGTAITSGLFVVSAATAVAGQLRLTGWPKTAGTPARPWPAGGPRWGWPFFPWPSPREDPRRWSLVSLVATHYGFYNTVSGLGITLGNLATGALWDFALRHDALWLTWCVLTVTGLGAAASVSALARTGRLAVGPPRPVSV